MKKLFKLQFVFALVAILFSSCSDDDPTPSYPSIKGDFIVSQGNFKMNNGAISLFGTETTDKNIYKTVNDFDLGDVVQDFEIVDTLGFIVVNNSQKLEVVRMRDFKKVVRIDDEKVTYPRYVVQATENTVYISNGAMEGEVLIYDFKKFELVGDIKVGVGPEMMAKVGNKMYVANSGGWGTDKTVSVIDINQGKVIKTIEVDVSSVTLKADNDKNIWVYSKGVPTIIPNEPYDIYNYDKAKLFKINTSTDEVISEFALPGLVGTYGSNLFAISESDEIYFITDGVYKMSTDATEVPTSKWGQGVYFGIEVNPENGTVYGLNSITNEVEILNATDASIVKKYTETKAMPHSVVFNY
ncbi:MAG: hypothetical protein N4A71_16490 [Carboxylicivirga sp.]|jgi:phenolic acid decarboxylase|nr:hypothetical protein [Carboxylicivirga sp.]